MIYKETDFEVRPYMYTAVLDNGVTITAYEDGTADGNDGRKYRAISHIDKCEFYDVLDDTITDGWEILE